MEAENTKKEIKKNRKNLTGRENTFPFILIRSVNFSLVMRQKIRKILIAFFVIVPCMRWEVNVGGIISIQKMG